MNTDAMYKLTYGLFVLTARENDKNNGCIINTAIQVTLKPNTLSVCVEKSNYTHDMLMRTGEFNISVIAQNAKFDLFKHFGFCSGREVDKFKDFECFKYSPNGIPYITGGTNAYMSARVEKTVDLGSHTMFVGEATAAEILSDSASATYEYYLNSIKPKPTKSEGVINGKTVWRCKICGYEYVGEELPADYICPLCKHPSSDFEKIIK